MVCPRCTVLCVDSAVSCQHCGFPLRSMVQRVGVATLERTPAAVGIASGVALICCLSIGILFPLLASQALSVGVYFGIISIANTWMSVYRGDEAELLRGTRGLVYCGALLFSLISELARLQHVAVLPLPALPGLPAGVAVPSPMITELMAGVLIVLDPLVVTPVVRWIGEGVVREERA